MEKRVMKIVEACLNTNSKNPVKIFFVSLNLYDKIISTLKQKERK